MSEYKIEKGVPYPSESSQRRRAMYPFRDMEIGDSFLVKRCDRQRVANGICYMRRQHGLFFSICPEADGYRCWRIKPPTVYRRSRAGRKKKVSVR